MLYSRRLKDVYVACFFLWFSASDALYISEGVRLQERSVRVWELVQEERL